MRKINKPEEIFAEIEEDYRNIFHNALISIILYGSGAGSDFNPQTSDLNFLIILSEEAIDHLDWAIDAVSRWRKRNVAIPLCMAKMSSKTCWCNLII
jgi:hypothetical protein